MRKTSVPHAIWQIGEWRHLINDDNRETLHIVNVIGVDSPW